MRRSGNVLDNAALERLLAALKTERIARKTCRTRNQAKENARKGFASGIRLATGNRCRPRKFSLRTEPHVSYRKFELSSLPRTLRIVHYVNVLGFEALMRAALNGPTTTCIDRLRHPAR